MITPNSGYRLVPLLACCFALMAGCVSQGKNAALNDLRPSGLSGTKEKSLYEMAVSNEATRLRKSNPELSQKEAMSQARANVGPNDYPDSESPQEEQAKAKKEAQRKFADDLEKTLRQ
jgi:hypothetical protein